MLFQIKNCLSLPPPSRLIFSDFSPNNIQSPREERTYAGGGNNKKKKIKKKTKKRTEQGGKEKKATTHLKERNDS
jgi:hypothetical protein